MLLFSLSDNARTKLTDWYDDVCAQARNLCAPDDYDASGAITLVAIDRVWNAFPGNIDMLAGYSLSIKTDSKRIMKKNEWKLVKICQVQ